MKFSEYLNNLNEEALSRFVTILNSDNRCFGIVASSRQGQTPAEDKAAFRTLQALVRSADFGFRKIEGHYPEKLKGSKSNDVIDHIDKSVMITGYADDENRVYRFCELMMKRFKQDSFLFKHCDGTVELIYSIGAHEKLGKFHPNKISNYMSTFKNNRSFVFDKIDECTLSGTSGGQYGHMQLEKRLNSLDSSDFYLTYNPSEWFYDYANEYQLDW